MYNIEQARETGRILKEAIDEGKIHIDLNCS